MDIAILLYDRFTALDAVGPYEVLSRLPDARVTFVAREPGAVHTDTGMLSLNAEADLTGGADVILVPGGPGTFDFLGDCPEIDWIKRAAPAAEYVTSVCSGSLMLGAAGLLDSKPATSHWAVVDALASYGAIPTRERVVEAGNVITAAGVSAGIDMALTLSRRIAGDDYTKGIQLGIEYAPDPPFTMDLEDEAVREMAVKALTARLGS